MNPLTDQVRRLLAALGPTEEAGAEELMRRLKLRHRPTFRSNDLRPALNAGLMSPYLLELDIRFLEAESRAMIVKGSSYRTSLARMKPRPKVRRVLRAIFYGENVSR